MKLALVLVKLAVVPMLVVSPSGIISLAVVVDVLVVVVVVRVVTAEVAVPGREESSLEEGEKIDFLSFTVPSTEMDEGD